MKGTDYRFKLKLSITRTGDLGTGFGPGIAQLLSGVEKLGSLNRSAKEMDMAYSKAWTLVREVEQNLQISLMERKGAGGSVLTTEGKEFLQMFLDMEDAAYSASSKVFESYMQNKQRD